MKIAVLIPAYNAEQYLPQCLDSLLAQTIPVDVYCCDDGSVDATGQILDDYADRFACVRVFHQPNRGMSATYNRLLDELPSDYDAFGIVDADDYVHPETYERLSAALERTCSDVAECEVASVPAESRQPDGLFARAGAAELTIDDMSVYWTRRTAPGAWINKWNKLYRRAVVKDLRFRVGLDFEDDYFFACEVNAVCRRKVLVPGVFYAYRRNPSSMNGRLNLEKYASSATLRIKLSCETFLFPGRIPAHLVNEWMRDLSKDAYRMLVRKNLKKNCNSRSRRDLFRAAGESIRRFEIDYGLSDVGLNPVQKLLYSCCKRNWYVLARLLATLT